MFAYPFQGYWKDVGTIESLWDANMELLHSKPELELDDDSWRIYSKNPNKPPHYVGDTASVHNSLVSEGCFIYGTVENSVLFPGVVVEKGATIKDSIIMEESHVGKDSRVIKAILDQEVRIGQNCLIGGEEAITCLVYTSVVVNAIKVLLFFFFKNSGTGGVGELANFIMGLCLVLPAALIYRRKKTRKRALVGTLVGVVAMTVASGLLNY